MDITAARAYRRDPLGFVEHAARTGGDVFPLPDDSLCVVEPTLAMSVLRDEEGRYEDVSGFFHTGDGGLRPRAAQVAVGRAARALLRDHLDDRRDRLPALAAGLNGTSRWPQAGPALVHQHLVDVLLHPDRPPRLHRLVRQVVRRGVLARPEHLAGEIPLALLRNAVVRALTDQVRARRAAAPGDPADLLDAVVDAVDATSPGTGDRAVAEVYLMLFRSVIAPIGYAVAWSLRLTGAHQGRSPGLSFPWPAEWVVRESLRLWPVAWQLARTVRRPHELGGVPVRPGKQITVCTYLLHRDQRHWPQAEAFRPDRWADTRQHGPYLPFGAGPFVCAGAAVAHTLAADLLTALTDRADLTIHGANARPYAAGIVVPARFILRRTAHRAGTSTPIAGRR
ncbi:cytochrome P450 [Saccharothrix lopnurensis]|uniref:Cytochrome P450 n=1 Tax=Saccharothrix lopnurensis TaxID=1670621 RepID=A0ABW1P9M0_9PSEU